MTIGHRILKARTEARLTQQQLANAIGKTRGAVAQWESGSTRPRERVLEEIARATKTSKEWLLIGDKYIVNRANITIPVELYSNRRIPVYGQAIGGKYGEFPFNGKLLFDIPCPLNLQNVPDAYAVVVSGESMSPRYEDGEIVYIDPSRRVKRGNYVVIQILIDLDPIPHAFIKRFIKHDAIELVVEQLNPHEELKFQHKSVVSVHYIVMSGESL